MIHWDDELEIYVKEKRDKKMSAFFVVSEMHKANMDRIKANKVAHKKDKELKKGNKKK